VRSRNVCQKTVFQKAGQQGFLKNGIFIGASFPLLLSELRSWFLCHNCMWLTFGHYYRCNCPRYRLLTVVSLRELSGETDEIIRLKQISPVAWKHINFLGRYEFEKAENSIDIDKIVDKLSKTPVDFRGIMAY
jgi:hypothetical protein